MSEFHITFAIEPALTKKQQRHNANELTLFDPRTKWTGNELPTNMLKYLVAKCMTSSIS